MKFCRNDLLNSGAKWAQNKVFWQTINYENVPLYYCHCWHIGHQESQCHVHNPALRSENIQQPIPPPKQKQVYVPKNPQPQLSTSPLLPQNSDITDTQKVFVPVNIYAHTVLSDIVLEINPPATVLSLPQKIVSHIIPDMPQQVVTAVVSVTTPIVPVSAPILVHEIGF